MLVAFTASIFFFLLLIHVESEVLMPHEVGKFWKSKRQGKGKIAALMPLYQHVHILPTTQLNGAAKMYGRREKSYNCLLLAAISLIFSDYLFPPYLAC
jgi:hypothetical protein